MFKGLKHYYHRYFLLVVLHIFTPILDALSKGKILNNSPFGEKLWIKS